MTYGITVKSHEGNVEITGHYGDIPDGVHEITGHEGAPTAASGGHVTRDRNIQVSRRDHEGRHVIGAQHHENAPA